METEIVKILQDDFEELLVNTDILKAAAIIKNGGLVAFPTETVYGLGANALRQEAAKKIYAAKGRPSDNPLIVHISEIDDVKSLVKEIPQKFNALAQEFWPGPMTVVLKKSNIIPYATSGGLETVAIRMPSNNIARALIKASGVPIAAPSANASGRPSPTKASHVLSDMNGRIDMILDGGSVDLGVESTIVDLTDEIPAVLRPGSITIEMLKKVCGKVNIDPAIEGILPSERAPKAPGMKYKHYAPKADMHIVRGSDEDVLRFFEEKIINSQYNIAIITVDEHYDRLKKLIRKGVKILSLGSLGDIKTIAHNLFGTLRLCDDLEVDFILCEAFCEYGLGKAVMNRLKKAAGYNIIDL